MDLTGIHHLTAITADAPQIEVPAAISPASPDALRMTFPPDGAELRMTGPLTVKARGGRGPWTFLLNGAPVAIAQKQPIATMNDVGLGFNQLMVVDAGGASAIATIRLQ